MEMNFDFEGDEDWDVELIQDLVRREEEAIAAKRATQLSSCANPVPPPPPCGTNVNFATGTKNANADFGTGTAILDAYMYSFSPPRVFNDRHTNLRADKPKGVYTGNIYFDTRGTQQSGLQNTRQLQGNLKTEIASSSQVNRNVEHLQRELERLSEQLLFQDQENLELHRNCDEKEEQLRRALEAVAAKDAEIERLKKMRQTEGSRERRQIDNMREASGVYPPENCGIENEIANIDDAWSPPWTTKNTSKNIVAAEARGSRNLCPELTLHRRVDIIAKDEHIGTPSMNAELRARVLTENASKGGDEYHPSQAQELHCRETTAVTGSGKTRGTRKESYQDAVECCERDNSSGLGNLSKKLLTIWNLNSNKRWGKNLVSKLFVFCGMDLYILLGRRHGSSKDNNITMPKHMLCNGACEGGHTMRVDKDSEAQKMHLLSFNLYIILAKLVNAMAPPEALIESLLEVCSLGNAEVIQSALRVLNFTLCHECNFQRENLERACFPEGIHKRISGNLNSLEMKRSSRPEEKRLRAQDCIKLASGSKSNVDMDVGSLPYSFSSRIHCRNRELGNGDQKASVVVGIDKNNSISTWANCKKQIFTRCMGGHNFQTVKWITVFQRIHQIALENASMGVKVQAISAMNLIVMNTNPNSEREQFGPIVFCKSLSQLLRKNVGINVQLQAVRLLFLLLNCPRLLKLFCGCNKDIETDVENSDIQIDTSDIAGSNGMVLEGLAECISCSGNDIQEYALRRNAVNVLAFITASGNMGVGCLLSSMPSGCKDAQRRTTCNDPEKTAGPTMDANIESHVSDAPSDKSVHSEHCAPHSSNVVEQKMPNFPMLLFRLLNSELDAEEGEDTKLGTAAERLSKERATLIQETLLLLHHLVSHSMYSAPVLEALTNDNVALRLSLDVVNRIRSLSYHQGKRFQKTHPNHVDITTLAHQLEKRILSYVTDF